MSGVICTNTFTNPITLISEQINDFLDEYRSEHIFATQPQESEVDNSNKSSIATAESYSTYITNMFVAKVKDMTYDHNITRQKNAAFEKLKKNINDQIKLIMKSRADNKKIFSILPPAGEASKADNNKRKEELSEISTLIESMRVNVNSTMTCLESIRGHKPPGDAEARLGVILSMLEWLESDSIIKTLRVALSYGNGVNNKDSQDSSGLSISQRLENISSSYVSTLFVWLFFIKFDELKHEKMVKVRKVQNGATSSLLCDIEKSIKFVNTQSQSKITIEDKITAVNTNIASILLNLSQHGVQAKAESGLISSLLSYLVDVQAKASPLQNLADTLYAYNQDVKTLHDNFLVEQQDTAIRGMNKKNSSPQPMQNG